MTSVRELSKQIRLLTAELQDVSFGEEQFLPDELEIANRTSRSFGAIGSKAVVPRVVRDWIQVTDKVLDFGAGKDAAHAVRLKSEGYNVTAHEFGKNQQAGLHDPNALQSGPYDVVYASNVLNVQASPRVLLRTLMQIRRALKPGGIFIGNYPKQPRKMRDLTPSALADKIAEVFGVASKTVRPGGMPKAGRMTADPVFFVRYKGYKGKPDMGAMTMASTDTKKAVQAAVAALDTARKATLHAKRHTVNAKHMQPQVIKTNVIVVDAMEGTMFLPGEDFDFAKLSREDEDVVNQKIEEQLSLDPGSVVGVEFEKNKYLARSSAPGYMDATDYSMFDTEVEAWSYLIDMDPSLFTWTVELTADVDEEGIGGTAHIYMDTDAAAKAMAESVQSVAGSKLERDGDFVYVSLTGNGEEVKDELESMGFDTEEG